MTSRRKLAIGPIADHIFCDIERLQYLVAALSGIRMSGEDRATASIIGGNINSNYDGLRRDLISKMEDDPDHDWIADQIREAIKDNLRLLSDVALNYSPPFTYIGKSAAGESDFGCWVDNEAIRVALQDHDMGQGDYLPSASVAHLNWWLQINDHGNRTLWKRVPCWSTFRWVKCWEVV